MICGQGRSVRCPRGLHFHRAPVCKAALMPSQPEQMQPVREPRQLPKKDIAAPPSLSGAEIEERGMMRCIMKHERNSNCNVGPNWSYPQDKLDEAYAKCAYITEHYAKTFFLGTQLMTPEKSRAVCAIYVWCRRTDELVDGPNADRITPEALDRWEERLEHLFEGRPCDNLDAALTDTVNRFPVDIQPFRDMIDGMRSDIVKTRYRTYDELYEYCYRVAGTVALMTMPVMGMDPSYKGKLEPVYRAALSLGIANQLTNILRDVGEDMRERNRIYVPLDELAKFDITEEELMSGMHCSTTGNMDDRYVRFTEYMIQKTMDYYNVSEDGIGALDGAARWPVWSALIVYRKILDAIQANEYDNITKRAYVPKARKMVLLPFSLMCAKFPSVASKISRSIPF